MYPSSIISGHRRDANPAWNSRSSTITAHRSQPLFPPHATFGTTRASQAAWLISLPSGTFTFCRSKLTLGHQMSDNDFLKVSQQPRPCLICRYYYTASPGVCQACTLRARKPRCAASRFHREAPTAAPSESEAVCASDSRRGTSYIHWNSQIESLQRERVEQHPCSLTYLDLLHEGLEHAT
jgi:hypothetical protein